MWPHTRKEARCVKFCHWFVEEGRMDFGSTTQLLKKIRRNFRSTRLILL